MLQDVQYLVWTTRKNACRTLPPVHAIALDNHSPYKSSLSNVLPTSHGAACISPGADTYRHSALLPQAHTWPGLRMKPQAGSLSNGHRDETTAGSVTSHAQQQTSAAAAPEQPPVQSSASAAPTHSSAYGVHASAMADAAQEQGSDEHGGDGHHAATTTEGARLNGLSGVSGQGDSAEESDNEEEGALEDFESMMRQLRQGRSNLQDLPDDERRARAASMAAQMMQALGINEEDTDDEP